MAFLSFIYLWPLHRVAPTLPEGQVEEGFGHQAAAALLVSSSWFHVAD